MPIYRRDEKLGEHYVVFDAEAIEMLVLKFFRQGNTANVNLMHAEEAAVDGVYLFESWIIDSSKGKVAPVGFEDLPDGSWFGSYKVDNALVWENFIRTGEFRGFSVEGNFLYREIEAEQLLDRIASILFD